MNELLKMALRNVRRNTRRSLLTVMMTLISVTIIVLSSSFLSGMFANLLSETIRSTGHVRVTAPEHDVQERKKSLTGGIGGYQKLKTLISNTAEVEKVVGRLRFGALVFKGDERKEALGYGIEPPDIQLLRLKDVVYQGRPLRPGVKGEIVIGRIIAESLRMKIGDEVTLLVRTINNSTWALNFRVVGFFDRQNKISNRSFYINLPVAQELVDMNDQVTEIMVFGKNIGFDDQSAVIAKSLRKLNPLRNLVIKRWDEIGMGATLMKMLNGVYTIMQLIFILLAGLGIANTMMMAVFERKSEIGILKALGMREKVISRLFILEGLLLGTTGTIIGLLIGGVLAYLMAKQGIDLGDSFKGLPVMLGSKVYGGFDIGIFIKGFLLGVGGAFIATRIPIKKIIHIKPSEAIRG